MMYNGYIDRIKRFIKRKQREMFFGKQVILVYSMGKVGTSSVSHLLKKEYPEIPSHHVHFLSDFWVRKKLPSLPVEFHANIPLAEKVYASLQHHSGHRLRIITMVREPMIREVSDIFENWRGLQLGNSIDELDEAQLKTYLDQHTHEYVLNWFDTEFKEYLGFDIYSQPFDKEAGYSIFKTPKADILCIQTEKLYDCFSEAIDVFAGLKLKLTKPQNTSEQKAGAKVYTALKNGYTPSDTKLKHLYNSRLVQHFYSEKDIDGFIRKWSHDQFNYRTLQLHG